MHDELTASRSRLVPTRVPTTSYSTSAPARARRDTRRWADDGKQNEAMGGRWQEAGIGKALARQGAARSEPRMGSRGPQPPRLGSCRGRALPHGRPGQAAPSDDAARAVGGEGALLGRHLGGRHGAQLADEGGGVADEDAHRHLDPERLVVGRGGEGALEWVGDDDGEAAGGDGRVEARRDKVVAGGRQAEGRVGHLRRACAASAVHDAW